MIELMVETWSGPKGTSYRWSLWKDGARVGMGGPHEDRAASEEEGRSFCAENLRTLPDRTTTL
jgi:hypothetical protein